jgi:signal transduction histidine kinase
MARFALPMVVLSGEVSRVNAPFEELLGHGAKGLTRDTLFDRIHPDDAGELAAAHSTGCGACRARLATRDGDWVPFEWRVQVGADGPALLGVEARDEEGKRSEPAADADPRQSTLAETLDAMVRIVEAKNPGLRCSVLLVDEQKRRITVGAGPSLPTEYNNAVEGLTIGPAVGSCGTAAFWNVPVVVEDIASDELWRDLREAAALAGVCACWSHPITATDGEVIGAMALYADEPKAPTQTQMDGLEIAARMVGLAVERGRLEDQLRQAAKMEALGVLAGGIAHDFNNMLTTMMGNAELALTTLPDTAPAHDMLQEIVAATSNAAELCNQMLAYTGRGALSTETVEVNALVGELGGLLQITLSKKATLQYDLSEQPLGVLADRSQLRQVIMNLITNASEALGNEPGRILVSTSAGPLDSEARDHQRAGTVPASRDYVRLMVSDTGSGMTDTTRARIFDPFFTTKSAGRGLGLAAVQGIVRSHGGVIEVESEPGRGTTTLVLLPRVELPPGDGPFERQHGSDLAGVRILVVDDEPKVLRVVCSMLESAGLEVLRASDGQEAIELFGVRADEIDCVLLDLSMPKLDGEEVFRELQRIRPEVRVVLSSGFTEQEILDRFRGAGLAGTVQKPASMEVLLARIAEAVGTGFVRSR